MKKPNVTFVLRTAIALVALGGCAQADFEDQRRGVSQANDETDSSTNTDTQMDTVEPGETEDIGKSTSSQPNPGTGEGEKETEDTLGHDSEVPTVEDTHAPDTQDEDTGPSPEEDPNCGALGQGCCGEGYCDDDSIVCVGGWPDENSASCLAMCNGSFCQTTENLEGTCFPTGDGTLTYCDGGTENPATQTCGAYKNCPSGSECLVQSTGASQGKCFKTGCDPYANCTNASDLCIPLIDSNEEPTGYGACIPLL